MGFRPSRPWERRGGRGKGLHLHLQLHGVLVLLRHPAPARCMHAELQINQPQNTMYEAPSASKPANRKSLKRTCVRASSANLSYSYLRWRTWDWDGFLRYILLYILVVSPDSMRGLLCSRRPRGRARRISIWAGLYVNGPVHLAYNSSFSACFFQSEQYFSLTKNQSTVFFNRLISPTERGQYLPADFLYSIPVNTLLDQLEQDPDLSPQNQI
jgi:hypothetical protein